MCVKILRLDVMARENSGREAKWYIIALPNCAVLGFELLDFHDVRQNMEALNIPVRT